MTTFIHRQTKSDIHSGSQINGEFDTSGAQSTCSCQKTLTFLDSFEEVGG